MAKIKFEESYVPRHVEEKPQITKEEEDKSVNDIFAEADAQISTQTRYVNVPQKKVKKAKSVVKGLIITLIVAIILAVVSAIGIVIYSYHQGVAAFKEGIIQEFRSTKEAVYSADEETLEVIYLKKMFELVSEEEMIKKLDEVTSLSSLYNIMKQSQEDEFFQFDLIPEEKRASFEKIKNEYIAAKELELQQQTDETSSVDVQETEPIDTEQETSEIRNEEDSVELEILTTEETLNNN